MEGLGVVVGRIVEGLGAFSFGGKYGTHFRACYNCFRFAIPAEFMEHDGEGLRRLGYPSGVLGFLSGV
jgi:hypothetical protein